MLKKFLRSGSCPTLQRLTKLKGASTDVLEIFGSARALPSRKKPFATRYSPFATFLKILLLTPKKKHVIMKAAP